MMDLGEDGAHHDRRVLTKASAQMSSEDLEKYEAEMELQLYREYRDVVGLFSYVVANPSQALTAGLALLGEASQEMTEGTVASLAAQCPSDVPHLLGFYSRYFKEHGRFPVLERVATEVVPRLRAQAIA